MFERSTTRAAALKDRFASVAELHQRLDAVEVATATADTLLDAVAGYELVRLHAVHRQRQASARLDELGC